MADAIATFGRFYETAPDPYAPRGAVLTPFVPAAGAAAPAALLGSLASTTYPVMLLMSSTDHRPVLAIAPFAGDTLPGVAAPNNRYAFSSDVSAAGNLPGLLEVTAECFHQVQGVNVLQRADVAAAWAALAAGALNLPPVPAGAANAHQVSTRRAMPVPHELASGIIQAQVAGSLSWRQLWTDVVTPLLADANLAQDYEPFIDYVQAASTQREPAAAGGAVRDPATELDHPGVLTVPALQDKAMDVARSFLPGLRPAVGVAAQLQQVQHNQTQLQAAIVAGQATADVTLESKNPTLLDMLLRINEVSNEGELAPYWENHPTLRTGGWNNAMDQATRGIAYNHTPDWIPPIMPPALTSDIGVGNFSSTGNELTGGFSIFRMKAGNSPNRDVYMDRNRVYTAMGLATGAAQENAVQMVMDNSDIELPEDAEEFRGIIEGYGSMCLAFVGSHNRAVRAYITDVVDERSTLIAEISKQYPDKEARKGVYIKIMTYIFRLMNDYLNKLARNPHPTAIGAPVPGGPAGPPAFSKIAARLAEGTIDYLTTIPSELILQAREVDTSGGGTQGQGGGAGGTTAGGGTGGNQGGGNTRAREVRNENQNKRLKNAWTATGHTSIFGAGSPYRDESRPDGKKLIMSDRPGVRICLPMALRGICYDNCRGKHGPLSRPEESKVAEAGNLTLEGT